MHQYSQIKTYIIPCRFYKVLPNRHSKCENSDNGRKLVSLFVAPYFSDMSIKLCRRRSDAAPASVAWLDARPIGDQEVAGSTPRRVGNILSWRLIMKYFPQ